MVFNLFFQISKNSSTNKNLHANLKATYNTNSTNGKDKPNNQRQEPLPGKQDNKDVIRNELDKKPTIESKTCNIL